MGMFDYVNYECTCPVCHSKIGGFQSKSGDCLLETLEPSEVTNFYSSCNKCGCWIDFKAKPSTNFTRIVTSHKDKKYKILSKYTKDVRITNNRESEDNK